MAITRPSPGPISSPYGYRRIGSETTSYHGGVDFVGAVGSPVRAVKDGVVYVSAPNGMYNRYGNLVVVKHDDPSEAPYSLYAHLNELKVRKGQRVKAGQLIGTMGNTSKDNNNPNYTVRTHLHFELLKSFPAPADAGRVDPMPYLNPTSSFYPVPSPTPPAPASTSYGPYAYPGYSYGQGPLRGLGSMCDEGLSAGAVRPPCPPGWAMTRCGAKSECIPPRDLGSVKWTSTVPWPFATAPGAGLSDLTPKKTWLLLGLLASIPFTLKWASAPGSRARRFA